MSATLFIVPTPIGNLGDISKRAIDTLHEVDLIACEDTRHSSRLLQHYGIQTPTISLHQHNESERSKVLLKRLIDGEDIALVSDAGTPLINDPGYDLVRLCRQSQVKVIALPGPCALVTALSACGISTDKFSFCGFLPVKQQAKKQVIEAVLSTSTTHVFYESPKRILSSIEMFEQIDPSAHLVVAKELTKTNENYVGNSAPEVKEWLMQDPRHQKGEFVIIVKAQKSTEILAISEEALRLLRSLAEELPPKRAAAITAKHYDLNKKELYQLLI